jgi:hypothetical protein
LSVVHRCAYSVKNLRIIPSRWVWRTMSSPPRFARSVRIALPVSFVCRNGRAKRMILTCLLQVHSCLGTYSFRVGKYRCIDFCNNDEYPPFTDMIGVFVFSSGLIFPGDCAHECFAIVQRNSCLRSYARQVQNLFQ